VGWIALLVSSGAAFATSTCDSDGFVFYPLWLWLCYVPIIVLKLYLQHQCLKYTTIPYIQVAGSFKTFRYFKCGFWPWYAIMTMMSIGQTCDYGTDGFFMAVVLRAGQCSGSKLESIWHEVMAQSVLGGISSLSFTSIAIISYVLVLLQPVLAFLQTTPSCSEESPKYTVSGDAKPFRNCLGNEKNYGQALFDLADVSDMCSIQVQQPSFAQEKAKKAWIECSPLDKVTRVLSHTNKALNRTMSRIGLVTLLENAYQINLQVSFLGLYSFIIEHGGHDQASRIEMVAMQKGVQISIFLGVIQGFLRLGETIQVLRFACWTTSTILNDEAHEQAYVSVSGGPEEPTPRPTEQLAPASHSRDLEHFPIPEQAAAMTETETEEVNINRRREIARVVAKALLLFMSALAFTSLIGYAVTKFYFVTWVCEDKLWNFSGCVDMSRFKNT
jgi:hypothetical protein